MRYYSLTISDPDGTVYQVDKAGLGFAKSIANQGPTFSSTWTPWQTANPQLVGQPNPNALNIEFDVPVFMGQEPQGGSLLRVWGLGIRCLSQASDFNPVGSAYKTFELRGGMSKGLPLANPSQAGLIAGGRIWQAFGNWEGTEQTLDLIIYPAPPPNNYGVPISWNWQKGQGLAEALKQMIAQAFPSYTPKIAVSSALVAPSDQIGYYGNIDAFFKYLHRYTRKLGAQANGSGYFGVAFNFLGNTIRVFDGTASAPVKELAFQDLVGQPTWIDVNTIIFPTVLRADIGIGDRIRFPTGVLLPYALTTPNAAYPGAPAASNSIFRGDFRVTEIHHFANSRQGDARSWNSTFTAISLSN